MYIHASVMLLVDQGPSFRVPNQILGALPRHGYMALMTSLHTASPVTGGAENFPQMHTALLFIAARVELTTMMILLLRHCSGPGLCRLQSPPQKRQNNPAH